MLFLVKTEPDEIEIVAQDDIIKEIQLLTGMVWGERHPGGVREMSPRPMGETRSKEAESNNPREK